MTRYANFGVKRTYVEAGFDGVQEDSVGVTTRNAPAQVPATPQDGPEKKKRKRKRPAKQHPPSDHRGLGGQDATATTSDVQAGKTSVEAASQKSEPTKRKLKSKGQCSDTSRLVVFVGSLYFADTRKFASERRRLQRQRERNAETICFACREKGHAAKDCRKAISAQPGEGGRKTGKQVVGICYRCGSRRHTLARCRKPVDPENPLPFSSCFVCSGKGHLASSCPQNKAKGIYPDGGCCTGREAGADEDDFHAFKRKTAEVTKEEKADERRKRKADVRVGALSGVVKSFGQVMQKPQKVVTF
ncbi:hypothetical protein NM688_g1934 [Phlebia brevispora]|uniref:Uncharacterized protein n=1 Tax=Phlebia brevispora TaxID=194682 RepID=A0ACC1TA68_9APHY|nr:hypothetical protein NM688_g1934 [Phlebia brevispora]